MPASGRKLPFANTISTNTEPSALGTEQPLEEKRYSIYLIYSKPISKNNSDMFHPLRS